MRHEKIIAAGELAWVDISAANWPATAAFASLPVVELDRPPRSEVHRSMRDGRRGLLR